MQIDRQTIIELAAQVGFEFDKDNVMVGGHPCTTLMTIFARAIAQRAAEEERQEIFNRVKNRSVAGAFLVEELKEIIRARSANKES